MAATRGHAGSKTTEASDAARPLLPELPKAQRRFKRRRLRCSVTLKTDDGKIAMGEAVDVSGGGLRLDSHNDLAVGDRGTAQVRIGTGEVLRVPVEVTWRNQVDKGEYVYGVTFTDINAADRFALLEAIYSPAHGFTGFVDSSQGADEEVQKAGSEPTTPAHYAYYMRLVRRMEQVHKVDPADSDRVLYARLMQGRPLREV